MIHRFVIAVLATWRVTHLLANEDGPWNSVARVRELAGGSLWGELMDCFKCLSLWVAAPFSLFVSGTRRETFATWLALSGGAVLIEEYIRRFSDTEGDRADDMLWKEESNAAGPILDEEQEAISPSSGSH